jgi:hypothetical protein
MGKKMKELENKDVRIVIPPQPGEAFEYDVISLLFAKNRINYKLIDTEKKAGRLF